MESVKRCYIDIPLLDNTSKDEFFRRVICNFPKYSSIRVVRDEDKIKGIPVNTISGHIIEIEWIVNKNWLYYESGCGIKIKYTSSINDITFNNIRDIVSKTLADLIRDKYYVLINNTIIKS